MGHHGGHRNSTKAQCKHLEHLNQVTKIANNQTLLDKVTKGNTDKANRIKAEAANATATINALQSNATLMTTCNAMFAKETMKRQCREMHHIERLNKLLANSTALSTVTKGNTTLQQALKDKASQKAATLTALSGNNTLTQFCSYEKTKHTCKAMVKLQKEVQTAANSTRLNAMFNGNADKIKKFQDRAAKAQTKLTSLMANNTLVSTCASINRKFTALSLSPVSVTHMLTYFSNRDPYQQPGHQRPQWQECCRRTSRRCFPLPPGSRGRCRRLRPVRDRRQDGRRWRRGETKIEQWMMTRLGFITSTYCNGLYTPLDGEL
jgi:hypothetical protein